MVHTRARAPARGGAPGLFFILYLYRCRHPDTLPDTLSQRKHRTLYVEFLHGVVDRPVERVNVGKGLMRQVMRLEVAPDHLDVVELRRILGQPLNGEPV